MEHPYASQFCNTFRAFLMMINAKGRLRTGRRPFSGIVVIL